MTERSRDECGRLDDSVVYADADFLDAVRDADLPTTGDVARAVGCERSTAYARLTALEDSGAVESEHVGSAFVWSLAD